MGATGQESMPCIARNYYVARTPPEVSKDNPLIGHELQGALHSVPNPPPQKICMRGGVAAGYLGPGDTEIRPMSDLTMSEKEEQLFSGMGTGRSIKTKLSKA
jgi:hypothetical protein